MSVQLWDPVIATYKSSWPEASQDWWRDGSEARYLWTNQYIVRGFDCIGVDVWDHVRYPTPPRNESGVWSTAAQYDGVAMGRGLRLHSHLRPCCEGGQGLAHRPVLLSERGPRRCTEVYHAGRVLRRVRDEYTVRIWNVLQMMDRW